MLVGELCCFSVIFSFHLRGSPNICAVWGWQWGLFLLFPWQYISPGFRWNIVTQGLPVSSRRAVNEVAHDKGCSRSSSVDRLPPICRSQASRSHSLMVHKFGVSKHSQGEGNNILKGRLLAHIPRCSAFLPSKICNY